MATNLRLTPDEHAAVREEAHRSGRSQQDVIRAAIDEYLALTPSTELRPPASRRHPRIPYRRVTPTVVLPPGMTSLDLLDRADRI